MTDLINVLATLTDEQRAAVADLLDAERKHLIRFWTALNELRCRREMPEWATKLGDGSHASMERARKSQQQVNMALFGKQELWDYGPEGGLDFQPS